MCIYCLISCRFEIGETEDEHLVFCPVEQSVMLLVGYHDRGFMNRPSCSEALYEFR